MIIIQVECVFRDVFSQLIIKVDSLLVKALLLFCFVWTAVIENYYLYFSGSFHLDQLDIATLIDYVAIV